MSLLLIHRRFEFGTANRGISNGYAVILLYIKESTMVELYIKVIK